MSQNIADAITSNCIHTIEMLSGNVDVTKLKLEKILVSLETKPQNCHIKLEFESKDDAHNLLVAQGYTQVENNPNEYQLRIMSQMAKIEY
ncbi:hypothetical protein L596_015858 [Steinernema carpocapsae]|nr:hypothetical protein L596_015858 [Steinernema carpocapsae]